MKPATVAVLALALALPAAAQEAPPAPGAPEAKPAPAGKTIPWVRDWEAAKERAAKEGKRLLVYLAPEDAWFT